MRPCTTVDGLEANHGRARRRLRGAWFRYVRAPLEEYRWIIVGVLGLLVLVFGYLGFDHLAFTQAESSIDKLYRALQLLTLQNSISPPYNAQLEFARWTAWVVTVGATIGALLGIFRDHVGRLRSTFARNHIVICGLGRAGKRLAAGFHDQGYKVVVIEKDGSTPEVAACRRQGIIVLSGDARDPALLVRAGVRKARHLIVVCGDDGLNVDVTTVAHRLSDSGRRRPLNCFTQVVDRDVRRFLEEFAIRTSRASIFRLRPFDVSELGVPGLLVEHPPFEENLQAGEVPHLVVVGLGQTGGRVVLGAAQLWATISPGAQGRLRITVIDKDAPVLVEATQARYPALGELLDLIPMAVDVDSPLFGEGSTPEDPMDISSASMAYVCLDQELRGFRTALILRRMLHHPHASIVVRTTERAALTAFPADPSSSPINVQVFNMLDRGCTPDVFLRGANEVLAQSIHAEYVRIETGRGETPETNPSMVDWDLLPEDLKESNRDQAAHIGDKLREIGCDIKSVDGPDPVPPLDLTTSEVEQLAHVEHARWVKERQSAGWTLAEKKDVEGKRTPFLVPWEALSEETRELDRNTVRHMPSFLAKAGFAVVRLTPESQADEPGRVLRGP